MKYSKSGRRGDQTRTLGARVWHVPLHLTIDIHKCFIMTYSITSHYDQPRVDESALTLARNVSVLTVHYVTGQ